MSRTNKKKKLPYIILYSDTQLKERSRKCYAKCVEIFNFVQRYNFLMVKVIEQLNHGPLVFNPKIGE